MTPVPPVRDCWDQFRAEPLIPGFASSSEVIGVAKSTTICKKNYL